MNVTLLGPQPTITKFIYKCYGIDILCSYVLSYTYCKMEISEISLS